VLFFLRIVIPKKNASLVALIPRRVRDGFLLTHGSSKALFSHHNHPTRTNTCHKMFRRVNNHDEKKRRTPCWGEHADHPDGSWMPTIKRNGIASIHSSSVSLFLFDLSSAMTTALLTYTVEGSTTSLLLLLRTRRRERRRRHHWRIPKYRIKNIFCAAKNAAVGSSK
jgi:hypothetical protein